MVIDPGFEMPTIDLGKKKVNNIYHISLKYIHFFVIIALLRNLNRAIYGNNNKSNALVYKRSLQINVICLQTDQSKNTKQSYKVINKYFRLR